MKSWGCNLLAVDVALAPTRHITFITLLYLEYFVTTHPFGSCLNPPRPTQYPHSPSMRVPSMHAHIGNSWHGR